MKKQSGTNFENKYHIQLLYLDFIQDFVLIFFCFNIILHS